MPGTALPRSRDGHTHTTPARGALVVLHREMVWLSQGLVHDDDADVAVISGAVVHHHDHDRVVVAEAWVTLRADTTRLQLPRGSFG